METEPCGVDCFLLQVCQAHSYVTYPRILYHVVLAISCCLLFVVFPLPCPLLKKGAKEFVDQNMLRSQRSRRRRRQQRPTSSSCPGPSGSAEEGKEGDSDHETTSSSGRSRILQEQGLELILSFLFCSFIFSLTSNIPIILYYYLEYIQNLSFLT